MEFIPVAETDSLRPGTGRTVEVRGRRFSVWNVDGEFFALDDDCPHRGAPLGAGVLENGQVFCPLHGWAFDARTGACLSNPARPVACHRTQVRDGRLWIEVASEKTPNPLAGGPTCSDRKSCETSHPLPSDGRLPG